MESTNPFVIIKTQMSFIGIGKSIYEKVYSPMQDTKPISPQEAMRIIERNNMHLAYELEDMKIWETEGNPFLKKYRGFFRRLANYKLNNSQK